MNPIGLIRPIWRAVAPQKMPDMHDQLKKPSGISSRQGELKRILMKYVQELLISQFSMLRLGNHFSNHPVPYFKSSLLTIVAETSPSSASTIYHIAN